MKTKRFLAVLMAASLLFEGVSANVYAGETSSDKDLKETVITVKAQGQVAEGDSHKYLFTPKDLQVNGYSAEEYGYKDNVTSGVSALDVLVAMTKEIYKDDFTEETAEKYLKISDEGWISTLFESADGGYSSYIINDNLSYDLINSLEMKNDDTFSIYIYSDKVLSQDVYVYPIEKEITAEYGENVEIAFKGKGYDSTWNFADCSVEGISLGILNSSTNEITPLENVKLDENGKATISNLDASTYDIVAYGKTNSRPVVMNTVKVTVNPKAGFNSVDKDENIEFAGKMVDNGTQYLLNKLESRGENEYCKYGDEWTILTLQRAGKDISDADKKAYVQSVYEKLKADSITKVTDYSKVILTLSALGVDVTDFYGYNLPEKIYNDTTLDSASSNYVSWALVALDCNDYEIPDDALWTREKLVDKLLTFQNDNGAFGLYKNGWASLDMSSMVVQSLAKHKDESKVAEAIDKALAWTKGQMEDDYGFVEGGKENSCTQAQVIVMLSALNMNPLDEANGFSNGKNMSVISNMEQFYCEDGGFSLYPKGKADFMSTYQSTYSLVSFQRLMNGENYLYDLRDVKTASVNTMIDKWSGKTDETDNKPEEDKKDEVIELKSSNVSLNKTSYTYTGKAIKPKITVTYNKKKVSASYYKVSYKNNTKVGTATVTVKFSGKYKGTVTKKFTIKKADLGLKLSVNYKTIKKSSMKKGVKVQLKPRCKYKVKYTYSSSAKKYIVVSKSGAVRIKKNTPKGKYYIKIVANKNSNYKTSSVKFAIKVK